MRNAEKGDLLTYIIAHDRLDEKQARIWARQIALALQYLHEAGIAHRDLKCENILITSNFNAKLSDFGFSRYIMENGEVELSRTYCGSFDYAAPEILKGQPYDAKASDMWAFGVMMYVMLNKSMPFKGRTKVVYAQQMARKWQFKSKVKDTLSSNVKNLVASLFEPNPLLRWTVDEVLQSEWITDVPELRKLKPDEYLALSEAPKAKKDSQLAMIVKSKLKISTSNVITTIREADFSGKNDFVSRTSFKPVDHVVDFDFSSSSGF
ncbi:testis-specific serine/threonine-protein kinase 3-like isoform X2 [Uranotaenia lowii]|nr:testis-specific serine/threonine-protein kinase 3-like isoform X2 [Uranotaenia lowii]